MKTGTVRKISEKLAKGEDRVMLMRDAERLVPYVLDAIKDVLLEEGEVNIRGLCSLRLVLKEEHPGRNPLTGEAVTVPTRLHAKCKFSEGFKKELREIDPSYVMTE